MKGAVRLPIFIDDARKYVNTTQLRAKYLGASYEAEYCQWQTLHGLGSLMETASLIITPNAYLEGKLIASYPPDPIGDFDFVRATTATRVNSAGLVELVPYNLLSWSEDFSNVAWTQVGTTITANSTTAPNGTLTADTIAWGSYVGQNFTHSGVHTFSVYAKYIGTQWLFIENYNFDDLGAWFDIQNGVVGTIASGVTANIESVGSGWYRCSVTMTATSAYNSTYAMFNTTANGNYSRTGSSYFWGAQINEGTLKPYQKTETRLNIPRLDYSNGTCPSLLVEPQRTNVILNSEDFSAVSWINFQSTETPNDTIAPNGLNTADRMTQTGAGGGSVYVATVTLSASSTVSCYFKAGSTSVVTMDSNGTGGYWGASFNLNTLAITYFGSGTNGKIESVGNGWYRCSVSATITGVNYLSFGIAGNISDYVYIWGAQLEAGAYPTSYIPTTSASVTRNADVISKTGISSLFGTNQGTFFCDFIAPNSDASSSQYIFDISDGSSSTTNRLAFYKISSNQYQLFTDTSTTITINQNTRNKVAIVWNGTNVKIYANGTEQANITYANTNPTKINLGSRFTNAEFGKVYFDSSVLWKTALTNTQLATLTTI